MSETSDTIPKDESPTTPAAPPAPPANPDIATVKLDSKSWDIVGRGLDSLIRNGGVLAAREVVPVFDMVSMQLDAQYKKKP